MICKIIYLRQHVSKLARPELAELTIISDDDGLSPEEDMIR